MAMMDKHRDPIAARRLSLSLLFVLLSWPVLQAAGFDLFALFDPANLRVMSRFLSAFVPPQTGTDFLHELLKATLETLAIATAGMLLALLVALPLAYRVSRVCRAHTGLQPVPRGLLSVLRGIPELVWALLFVRVMGLGPAAGVLALGLTYGGMLAKVYAESPGIVRPDAGPCPESRRRKPTSGYALRPVAAGGQRAHFLHRIPLGMRFGCLGSDGLCRRRRPGSADGPGHEDAQRR